MKVKPSIRLAILGTGSIGMRHLRVFSRLPGVEVFGVPVRSKRVAELEEMGFRAARSLDELGVCDAGIIATDTSRHVADLKRLDRAGIQNILIEKPLASSVSNELKKVSASIRKRKGSVFIACCMRFEKGLEIFRKELRSLGKVYQVQIDARSYLPEWRPHRDYRLCYSARKNEGGVLRDLIHEVDYAMWIFGAPQKVFGRLEKSGFLPIQSEDQAFMSWKTASRTHVSIGLDYLSRAPVRKMIAYGSKGSMILDFLARKVQVLFPSRSGRTIDVGGIRDDMYVKQAEAFVAAVRKKKHGPLATLSEGLQALAICDAVRKSSMTGRLEKVSPWN